MLRGIRKMHSWRGPACGLGELTTMKLFSRINRRRKKGDDLRFDLPEGLRVQIVQVWEKGFGPDESYHPGPGMAYERINQVLCEEHKVFCLPPASRRRLPFRDIIAEYFLNLEDISKALDVIQVVFTKMKNMLHRTRTVFGENPFNLSKFRPAKVIKKLNRRFRENNIGYQYL